MAVTAPTGIQVTRIAAPVDRVGVFSSDEIDADTALYTTASITTTETAWINTFSPTDEDNAFIALCWIIWYRYFIKSAVSSKCDECKDKESYAKRIELVKEIICGYLTTVGISSVEFCGVTIPAATIETVTF